MGRRYYFHTWQGNRYELNKKTPGFILYSFSFPALASQLETRVIVKYLFGENG